MSKSKMRFFAIVSTLVLMVFMAFKPIVSPIMAATTPVKIMPLGDSITDGDYWRSMLFNKLTKNGFNVESVGTRSGGHEGHWGFRVTDIAQYNQLVPWLAASNPDIVIMHLGTNDCWQNVEISKIMEAYTKLIGQMRDNNPNMIIVVAQIIPLHPDDAIDYAANVKAVNDAIPDWAAKLTTEASPIIVCDQFTGFDVDVDTCDGAHPSGTGSEKMCNNWYKVLVPILEGKMPEGPQPTDKPIDTPEPTDDPQPTTPPAHETGSLKVEPTISNWGGGYTASMNITNTSNKPVTNWELRLNKADVDISSIWCVILSEEGEELVIKPMGWNSTIAPGETITFGFQGTGEIKEDFSYTIK